MLNIQPVGRLTVYSVLIYSLWQTGKIALDHQDERVLGFHLLQFSEVGNVHGPSSLRIYTCVIIQKDAYNSHMGFPAALCFRLLRRHAPIYCPMCCVNTYIIYQRSLQKSFIPIVRYSSNTIGLCFISMFWHPSPWWWRILKLPSAN